MWKSLILAIMGEKSNLMHILYNTENFFLSPYLIKIVGKSRFLSKQKRVLLYLWDIMNEIMLRFDIKMRKIYVHSPFNDIEIKNLFITILNIFNLVYRENSRKHNEIFYWFLLFTVGGWWENSVDVNVLCRHVNSLSLKF